MSLLQYTAQLKDLFSKHNCFQVDDPPPSGNLQEEVADILAQIAFNPHDPVWQRFLNTRPGTYARNLISYSKDYAIVLISWKPGQGTPRHVHSEDNRMQTWIRVLRGTLTLTKYLTEEQSKVSKLQQGEVYQFSNQELGEHTLCNALDASGKHEIAYSLHVYSPPLLQCCNNPVVFCGTKNTSECTDDIERVVVRANDVNDPHAAVYTNFRLLVEVLHREILPLKEGEFHSDSHICHIQKLLEAMRFNRQEYSNYTRFENGRYTRNLVGYDVPVGSSRAKFTILILCWDKGQMSPVHDHAGSSCWVKVLQGKLREVKYAMPEGAEGEELEVVSDNTLEQEQVAYINDNRGIHAMGNPESDQVTISMHVYSPPYVVCRLFNPTDSKAKTASMSTVNMPDNPFRVLDEQLTESEHVQPVKRVRTSLLPIQGHALSLSEFLGELKSKIGDNGECAEAEELLGRLKLEEHEWKEFVHFDPFQYTRSLVALDSKFSLMVLCWNKDQSTPIHDHGCGIHSWAKVLSGSLKLCSFSDSISDPTWESSKIYRPGECIGSSGYSGLHKLGNESGDSPAVSLHLFSPPFVSMGYLDEMGVERSIPIVHSATSIDHRPNCSLATQVQNHTALPVIYTDLESMADCFDSTCEPSDIAGTTHTFERLLLHPEEWMKYHQVAVPRKGRTESLVARKEKFALVLLCFPSGYVLEPTRSKRSWLKVLQGQLHETVYSFQAAESGDLMGDSAFQEIHRSTLTPGSVTFISSSVAYSLENTSSNVCFALRLVAR